jgi:hypothetical protein
MTSPRNHDLANRLADRDWDILESVRSFKYLTTRQLARQHFGLEPREKVIPRNANGALSRLREFGLLSNLERRIGGVRAGSGGHVWQITDLARRLLQDHLGEKSAARVRAFEPSSTFLEHTLAVAEVVLSLREEEARGIFRVTRLQVEPESWRSYLGPSGETRWLKPDLAVVTTVDGFEDHWFIEIDRATEPPNRIVKKCLQYQEYRRSEREQARHGVFPAVVWVVPNARRLSQLRGRVGSDVANKDRLFSVVTADELSALVVAGAANYANREESP